MRLSDDCSVNVESFDPDKLDKQCRVRVMPWSTSVSAFALRDDRMNTQGSSPSTGATTGSHAPEAVAALRGTAWMLLLLPWAVWFWAQARKVVVTIIGTTVLLAGIAMLVLPGPGGLVILGGLSVLATEFAWARWALIYAGTRMKLLAERYMATISSLADPTGRHESREQS